MSQPHERIKEIRVNLRKSQREMAESMGYKSYKSWAQLESGERFPSFETLTDLAKQGFNPAWIVTGEGFMKGTSGINEAILQKIVEIVETWLEENDAEIDPEAKGKLFASFYKRYAEEPKIEKKSAEIIDFLEVAARKRTG